MLNSSSICLLLLLPSPPPPLPHHHLITSSNPPATINESTWPRSRWSCSAAETPTTHRLDGVHVPVLPVPEQLQVSQQEGSGARLPDAQRVGARAAAVHGQDGVQPRGRSVAEALHRGSRHGVGPPGARQAGHHTHPELCAEQVARRSGVLRRDEHHLPRHRGARLPDLRHERQLLPRRRVHPQSPRRRREGSGPLHGGREPLGHAGSGLPDDPTEPDAGGGHQDGQGPPRRHPQPGLPPPAQRPGRHPQGEPQGVAPELNAAAAASTP